jgi:hypothetical protein
MKPLAKVSPPKEKSPEREACDKAFALACRYSGGRDLVEEMVASNFWPLGKRNEEFTIEMVHVPVFGPAEVLSFPRFDQELPASEDKEAFVVEVEEGACQIVGKMINKEYLARMVAGCTIPQLNRVLEELGIHHEEYDIPADVLTVIEEKKKKAAAKNTTVVAEAKKRKGTGASRVVSKKLKVSTTAETSAASAAPSASDSARASASTEDVSDGSSGRAPTPRALTPPVTETEKLAVPEDIGGGQGVEIVDHAEPSTANPKSSVLYGDSSSSKGEVPPG